MNVEEFTIVEAKGKEHFEIAKKFFAEYLDELDVDLSFQGFKEELNNLKQYYTAPKGFIIFLKNNEGEFIACSGVRFLNKEKCEFKRMYVLPDYRKQGIGQFILQKCIERARELNFEKIQLDTLGRLTESIKYYREIGFYEIPPFRFNPYDDAMYFEFKL